LELLLKFPADFQVVLLLLILEQLWHKLRQNHPHVQVLLDGQSMISQYQIPNFRDFSGVTPVDGRPERSPSSAGVRPLLKGLYES
jgi:hypothetical protein